MNEGRKKEQLNIKSDSAIKIKIREEEENYFGDEKKRRHRLETRSRTVAIMAIAAAVIYAMVIVLPNGMSATNRLSVSWFFEVFRSNIEALADLIGGNANYMKINMIRTAAAGLAGAALSVSGAVYQGSFKNAMASPTTLGVQSGGVMGGMIYVMLIYAQGVSAAKNDADTMSIFQKYEMSFFVLAGCFFAVALIVTLSKIVGRGRVSSVALILSGFIFSGFIGGIEELVQYRMLLENTYDDRTYLLRYMMMGSFDRVASLEQLLIMGIPIVTGIGIIIFFRNRINILVFGEEEAKTMGINAERERNITVAVVTAITAVVISFCGMIGFAGFIIPHIARRFTGPDLRYLIPASALLGADIMMFVYYAATCFNYSTSINFMTSLAGGLIFLCMLIRFRSRKNADWA